MFSLKFLLVLLGRLLLLLGLFFALLRRLRAEEVGQGGRHLRDGVSCVRCCDYAMVRNLECRKTVRLDG